VDAAGGARMDAVICQGMALVFVLAMYGLIPDMLRDRFWARIGDKK